MTHIHKTCGQLCTISLKKDGSTYTDVKCSACGRVITVREYTNMDEKVREIINANFYMPDDVVLYPTHITYSLFDSGVTVEE